VESHSEWFNELAPLLVEQGYSVYAPDRPGWGQSSGRRGHLASYEDLLAMVDTLQNLMRKEHQCIHLAGLSWGGKAAVYIALRRPHVFSRLALIAPGLCPSRSPSLLQKLSVARGILAGNGLNTIPLPIAVDDFTTRSERQAYIQTDPSRIKEVTAAFCLESVKMDRYIAEEIERLRIPTLLLLAGKDSIIDNQATQALLERAPHSQLTVHTHEDAAHSLVFETPERTATELNEWFARPEQPHPAPKKILIMGAGAVGSAVGGLLAKGGHRVTLVARQAHADAIHTHGLDLTVGESRMVIRKNLNAVTEPGDEEAPDLVIVCVKGFDTGPALEALKPITTKDTVLMSLQNGVQNESVLAGAFPENPVLAGAICAYLSMEGPGQIHAQSDRGGLALGPHRPQDAEAAQAAFSLLRDSGMKVLLGETGEQVKWSKLMLNVAFNAINALTGLGTAEIMSHPLLGPLAVATFAECSAVMKGRGLAPMDLPGYKVGLLAKVMGLPTGLARRLVAFTTRGEAKGKSSMAQDFARGRAQTEIDEINGTVVQAGEPLKIPCPANQHLINMVQLATQDPAMRQAFLDTPELVAEGWPER
jgi:2-dehydropantoate 2-reductase